MDPLRINQSQDKPSVRPFELTAEDKFSMANMKYAMGVGASLRYANELRAVQQPRRLFMKSSNLHEDVLRGRLGPGNFSLRK